MLNKSVKRFVCIAVELRTPLNFHWIKRCTNERNSLNLLSKCILGPFSISFDYARTRTVTEQDRADSTTQWFCAGLVQMWNEHRSLLVLGTNAISSRRNGVTSSTKSTPCKTSLWPFIFICLNKIYSRVRSESVENGINIIYGCVIAKLARQPAFAPTFPSPKLPIKVYCGRHSSSSAYISRRDIHIHGTITITQTRPVTETAVSRITALNWYLQWSRTPIRRWSRTTYAQAHTRMQSRLRTSPDFHFDRRTARVHPWRNISQNLIIQINNFLTEREQTLISNPNFKSRVR